MNLSERIAAARDGFAVGPVLARGFLRATGADALDFLHRMSTQDLNRLVPGETAYGAFLDSRGHLLGEGQVLRRDGEVLLALAPEALQGTLAHLDRLVIMDDVVLEDRSAALRAIPVLGAAAPAALPGGGAPVPNGRRGAPCVELWVPAEEAGGLRAALVAAGAVPLEEADLEALRILAGIPRFGVDMDASRLPMEAGLTREAISFTKGCYVGQETVMRATARGHLQRGLVQLALPSAAGPGAPLAAGGQEVGTVTSAVDGPDGRVGLGWARRAQWPAGTRLATAGGEAVVVRPLAWEPEG